MLARRVLSARVSPDLYDRMGKDEIFTSYHFLKVQMVDFRKVVITIQNTISCAVQHCQKFTIYLTRYPVTNEKTCFDIDRYMISRIYILTR